jgi:hypothetical protein
MKKRASRNSWRLLSLATTAASLLVLVSVCRAGYRPSFSLEECAWNAPDIVLASNQGPAPTVLETWRGELTKAAAIQVLDLPKAPLEVTSRDRTALRKTVGSQQVVLFLKPAPTPPFAPGTNTWVGVSAFGGTQVSAVWIDDGHAYAFLQVRNPGPTQLRALGKDAARFKQETLDIVAAKGLLARAIAIAEPARRVEALEPMAKGKYWHQRHEAIAALGNCGPAAVVCLRQMLRTYGNETGEVTSALARAAGENAGPEMTAVLEEDVAFWKSVAADLPVGWWNNLSSEQKRHQCQSRYCILGPAMGSVVALHYSPARKPVLELRDLWVSLPQLNDKSGLNQITEGCNQALLKLEPAAGAQK